MGLKLTGNACTQGKSRGRCRYVKHLNTVDSEMFARTLFSLIFANPGPRKKSKFSLILKSPDFR